jgi:hypothetical protein
MLSTSPVFHPQLTVSINNGQATLDGLIQILSALELGSD